MRSTPRRGDGTPRVADAYPEYREANVSHSFEASVRCVAPGLGEVWTAETDGSIAIRRGTHGTVTVLIPKKEKALCLAVAHVENHVWATLSDGFIRVFDVSTAKLVKEFVQHDGPVYCLAHSENRVFTGGADWKIYEWNVASTEYIRQFYGHLNSVRCLNVHFNQTTRQPMLISGSDDCTLRVWDPSAPSQHVRDVACLQCIKGHTKAVLAMAIFAPRNQLWSGGEDHCIRVTDLNTFQTLAAFEKHVGPITAIEVVQLRVWTAAKDGVVRIFDPATLTPLREFDAGVKITSRFITSLRSVRRYTSQRVWAATSDGHVVCWSAEGNDEDDDFTIDRGLMDDLRAELVETRALKRKAHEEITELKSEIQRLREQPDRIELDALRLEAMDLSKRLEAARHKSSLADELLHDSRTTIAELEVKLGATSEQLESTNSQLAECKRENQQLCTDNSELLKRARQSQADMEDLRQRFSLMQGDRDSYAQQCEALTQQKQEAQLHLDEALARSKSITELLHQMLHSTAEGLKESRGEAGKWFKAAETFETQCKSATTRAEVAEHNALLHQQEVLETRATVSHLSDRNDEFVTVIKALEAENQMKTLQIAEFQAEAAEARRRHEELSHFAANAAKQSRDDSVSLSEALRAAIVDLETAREAHDRAWAVALASLQDEEERQRTILDWALEADAPWIAAQAQNAPIVVAKVPPPEMTPSPAAALPHTKPTSSNESQTDPTSTDEQRFAPPDRRPPATAETPRPTAYFQQLFIDHLTGLSTSYADEINARVALLRVEPASSPGVSTQRSVAPMDAVVQSLSREKVLDEQLFHELETRERSVIDESADFFLEMAQRMLVVVELHAPLVAPTRSSAPEAARRYIQDLASGCKDLEGEVRYWKRHFGERGAEAFNSPRGGVELHFPDNVSSQNSQEAFLPTGDEDELEQLTHRMSELLAEVSYYRRLADAPPAPRESSPVEAPLLRDMSTSNAVEEAIAPVCVAAEDVEADVCVADDPECRPLSPWKPLLDMMSTSTQTDAQILEVTPTRKVAPRDTQTELCGEVVERLVMENEILNLTHQLEAATVSCATLLDERRAAQNSLEASETRSRQLRTALEETETRATALSAKDDQWRAREREWVARQSSLEGHVEMLKRTAKEASIVISSLPASDVERQIETLRQRSTMLERELEEQRAAGERMSMELRTTRAETLRSLQPIFIPSVAPPTEPLASPRLKSQQASTDVAIVKELLQKQIEVEADSLMHAELAALKQLLRCHPFADTNDEKHAPQPVLLQRIIRMLLEDGSRPVHHHDESSLFCLQARCDALEASLDLALASQFAHPDEGNGRAPPSVKPLVHALALADIKIHDLERELQQNIEVTCVAEGRIKAADEHRGQVEEELEKCQTLLQEEEDRTAQLRAQLAQAATPAARTEPTSRMAPSDDDFPCNAARTLVSSERSSGTVAVQTEELHENAPQEASQQDDHRPSSASFDEAMIQVANLQSQVLALTQQNVSLNATTARFEARDTSLDVFIKWYASTSIEPMSASQYPPLRVDVGTMPDLVTVATCDASVDCDQDENIQIQLVSTQRQLQLKCQLVTHLENEIDALTRAATVRSDAQTRPSFGLEEVATIIQMIDDNIVDVTVNNAIEKVREALNTLRRAGPLTTEARSFAATARFLLDDRVNLQQENASAKQEIEEMKRSVRSLQLRMIKLIDTNKTMADDIERVTHDQQSKLDDNRANAVAAIWSTYVSTDNAMRSLAFHLADVRSLKEDNLDVYKQLVPKLNAVVQSMTECTNHAFSMVQIALTAEEKDAIRRRAGLDVPSEA